MIKPTLQTILVVRDAVISIVGSWTAFNIAINLGWLAGWW
jgi:hypothetical protein